MNRTATLNSNLAQNRTAEANANADIERRRSDVNNAYDTDVASVKNGAEATALQNQYNLYQQQQAQQRQDAIATLGAYSNDYQAQIDKIKNDNDPSNDYLINYLQTARQQKIQKELIICK